MGRLLRHWRWIVPTSVSLDLYFKAQDAEGNTSAASSAATFTIADVTGQRLLPRKQR